MIVQVEMPDPVWARLVAMADARGMKVRELIADAVADMVPELAKPRPVEKKRGGLPKFAGGDHDAVNALIRARLAAGARTSAIAAELDVTPAAITYRVKKYELDKTDATEVAGRSVA